MRAERSRAPEGHAIVEPAESVLERVARLPWPALRAELDARGFARVPSLLSSAECRSLRELYPEAERFRSRIVMSRHGFGRGEYQYFDDPLPELVETLRSRVYPELVPLANAWAERLRGTQRFPDTHAALRDECRAAGQTRPTPLLLKYGPDDYNCLHQDVYGELVFPLQLAVLLSEPGRDFTGGELVITEQRPRMQSRVEVVPLARGDAVIFAVRHRPVLGGRGDYRVALRHGVSRVLSGERFTLGVIFHDAE
jgi:hypothetical protein